MKTQKERMLAGELYVADDPELGRENHRAKRLVREFNQTTEAQPEERQRLLTAMFNKIGDGGYIEPPFHTDYGSNTTIGKHFYANYDAIFIDVGRITIGDNVFMGPRVTPLTPPFVLNNSNMVGQLRLDTMFGLGATWSLIRVSRLGVMS
ncbi:Galactoside O-acetyltransferase [Lactiplantibacillus plantarum]|nr:Galactoside O-acetyltransferase [Lactiplantibacillus plantarum]